jgi:hypothetical protein
MSKIMATINLDQNTVPGCLGFILRCSWLLVKEIEHCEKSVSIASGKLEVSVMCIFLHQKQVKEPHTKLKRVLISKYRRFKMLVNG